MEAAATATVAKPTAKIVTQLVLIATVIVNMEFLCHHIKHKSAFFRNCKKLTL